MQENYIHSVTELFKYYKMLGEKSMKQVSDENLFACPSSESNSIAVIVKHLWGNMLSRWTNFLTEDGEKTWRNREAEFDNDIATPAELWQKWEEGWAVLFGALAQIQPENVSDLVYIRNQAHTVLEAVNRQLGHYAYHVGQIVFLSKMLTQNQWQSLSIPRGQSSDYNAQKFAEDKKRQHFTDEFLDKK